MLMSARICAVCATCALSATLLSACGGAPAPTPPADEPSAVGEAPGQARAAAKPSPDPKMKAADRGAYRAALRDGRAAHRSGDLPAAIAAFDRALALFADDPRALNERGWARYKGGDLQGAEADTRQALARTVDRRLIGASWYNLGRIFEDREQAAEAADAYRRSLAARPNAIVQARLETLEQNDQASMAAVALAGPFADDAALCAHLKTAADVEHAACLPPAGPPIAGAPFGARFARTFIPLWDEAPPDPEGPGSDLWHLVLDVPAGRFVLLDVASTYNPGAFGIYEHVEFAGPSTRTLADGRTLAWLAVDHNRGDSDMGLNEVEEWNEQYVLVCGVGPSGVPACLGPLHTRRAGSRSILFEDEEEAPGVEHDLWSHAANFSVELLADGAVQVKPDGALARDADTAHVGVHRLVFP